MTSGKDLDLEQEVHLINEKERGLSHRELKDKFRVSLETVSNILKRKNEYPDDYESNQNKKFKRKLKDEFGQTINNVIYQWLVTQRSKKIPVSGLILQEYAKKVATEMNDTSGFKASNGWLERFHARHNIQVRVTSGDGASVNAETVEDGKARLPKIVEDYHLQDMYNCDVICLFFKLKSDRSLALDKNDCNGGRKS